MIRLVLVMCGFAGAANAETLRLATWNIGLTRDGPGLLLADFEKQTDEIALVVAALVAVDADVVVLSGFDNDFAQLSASAMQRALADAGLNYPHMRALVGNGGMPSGFDLNGDGRFGGWDDNWGFGRFTGNDSMVLLSRVEVGTTRSWSNLLWADLPDADMPQRRGAPFPNAETAALLRLSSRGHWDIALDTSLGPLHLFISNPTPPVFDGAEDSNGRRNNDEIGFWLRYLNGAAMVDDAGSAAPFSTMPFVVIGDLNADPMIGDGIGTALRALLAEPRVTDPAALQAPTAEWDGMAPMRVDYILPSVVDLQVIDGGIAAAVVGAATAHRLIWLEIALH